MLLGEFNLVSIYSVYPLLYMKLRLNFIAFKQCGSAYRSLGSLYDKMQMSLKVELSLWFLTEYHAMKTYWGVDA
jgi:hypothetical protein